MHFDENLKYFDKVGPTQISSTIFTYLRYISKQLKALLKTKSLSLVSYNQRTGSFCTYIVCQAGEVLHHTAEDAQTSSHPIPSDLTHNIHLSIYVTHGGSQQLLGQGWPTLRLQRNRNQNTCEWESHLCSLLGNDCWRELSWISNQNQAISTASDNWNQACWLCRLHCFWSIISEWKAHLISQI